MNRYERQEIIKEIGVEGQKKLKNSKVLVIGAGGLGSPIEMYLAAAGVGTIGIVDGDAVDESNLNRQIIHDTDNVGINKAESAKQRLKKICPDVNVICYPYYITNENAENIISSYDVIIDAVDNFETRFLVNDICVLQKKVFIHGGVIRFNGQVLTYVPGMGPCYRCIFDDVPEEGEVPTSKEVGILGASAGIIGSIQAMETIKYITGAGELLTGKMLIIDGLTMNTRVAKFPKINPNCPVCNRKNK